MMNPNVGLGTKAIHAGNVKDAQYGAIWAARNGSRPASANAAFRPSRDRPIRLRRRSLRPCAGAPGSRICSGSVGRTDIERPR